MNSITGIMQSRIDRANLNTEKSYIRLQTVKGLLTYKPVGRFIRSYRMGSGDGMTVHWEFNMDGNITTEGDAMWGSVSGSELAWFIEDTETNRAKITAHAISGATK